MWIQLPLVTFIGAVDTVVYFWENSSEVNVETVIPESLTFPHILDAEVLTGLCSGTKSNHAYCPV